ncbi:MAG TPA: hypothetical protein VMW30_02705 [Candidatus Paceibacterota bacterium]|nr:hypothetical protein [Candidatus Paceibacterota bacterium]
MDNDVENSLTPEELEEERAYFQLIYDLELKNHSRYEMQAELLMKNGEFSITINNSLLLYTLEDDGCTFRVSTDGGFDYCKLGWSSLGWRKHEKLKRLMAEFADSEARTILNR